MASRNASKELGVVEGFVGLLTAPGITVEQLLERRDAQYVLTFFASLVVVLLGPILVQLLRWDFLETRTPVIAALTLTLTLTGVFFIFLEYGLLRLLRVPVGIVDLSALFIYSCVPLAVLALLYYALNLFITGGRLTVATFLITGVRDADDWLLGYFPYVHLLAKLLFLSIFFRGLKFLANIKMSWAVVLALLSSFPFYIALLIAAGLVSAIVPGSIMGVLELGFSLRLLL